ncbi:hypothetical protein ACIQNG_15345 [Streptomyces sp. NPDC091377]|uniref:hypothetical protein n=1 Tax=Streptomyces sp. NPDC091377 TaxID=3365995 RepID=UPI003816EBFD
MTAPPVGPGTSLIPRPERTPAALARVAPHRLGEMERQQDEAMALAALTDSLGPITRFLENWTVVVEIARTPATAARLRAAEHTARSLEPADPAWRAAMDDIHALHTTARESLSHG